MTKHPAGIHYFINLTNLMNFINFTNQMTNRLLKYLSFGVTGVLVLILIAATLLEKIYGSTFVIDYIYNSPVFIILWGITAIAALAYLLKCNVRKQRITFCLHLSLILILAGALTTHVLGLQGSVHLRQGEAPVNTFALSDGSTKEFPFQVSLKEFRLEYYPGTFAPMDFVSTILIHDEGRTARGRDCHESHIQPTQFSLLPIQI